MAEKRRPLNLHQKPVTPGLTRPLEERGRVLYVEDIQALFGKTEDGRSRKSRNWVMTEFAPDARQMLGRTPFWWEVDALRWLDSQAKAS